MYCDIFADEGSGCENLSLECDDTNKPAGYFILHSFENIFAASPPLLLTPTVETAPCLPEAILDALQYLCRC